MPSEWAKETAEEVIGVFDCTSSKKPLRLAIAAEIDAARIKGLEEAAEIVQQQAGILSTVPPVQRATGYADAIKICTIAIRNRVKEVKG